MDTKSLKIMVGVAGLTAMLGGCTTLDAYTQESKTSNATKGAIIGAASGAVVGLISGDDSVERRKRALIGAGVGALAGGAIGYYMDQQEAKLRTELEGTGVSVTRIGDNITLNMPGNITFATGMAGWLVTTTSARRTRSSKTLRPSGRVMSRVRLRLLRLTDRNNSDWPSRNGGPQARASSPRPGLSILMIEAPKSASIIVA